MSEEDFQRAYKFFAKDTEKKVRKINSEIDVKLNAVNRDIERFNRKHNPDFSKSFNRIYGTHAQILNEKMKLRSKFKVVHEKRDDIERMRNKARKIRKY